MSIWKIRPARRSEADAVAAVEKRIFGARSWGNDGVAGGFDAKGVEILVAEAADGEIAGFAIWRIAANEAELLSIGVDEKKRQAGVGGALLQSVINGASDAGAECVFLDVDPANSAALSLYRRAGFIEIARRKAYYRNGADALILRRNLK